MNTDHETPEVIAIPEALSPGACLRQAREQAQLTEREVAQALHMSVAKVRAIENDDYSNLNAATFVRGYLRAYASLVKLDSAVLISAYEQQAIAQGLLPPLGDTLIRDTRQGQGRGWSFIVWLSGLLLILFLISVWFLGNPVAPPPASVAPAVMQSNPPLPASLENDAQELEAATTETPVEQAQEQQQATEIQVSSTANLDRLHLQFSEECWIEVSDAQGDVLATDLQRPGSELSLEGRAPFSLKLGNAPAVAVTLNDQPKSLNIPAGTKVMNVTLGE